MPESTNRFVASSILALASLAGTPALAVGPILLLEPTVELPSAVEGNGAPDVALRPDGGLVAVWLDLSLGQVVGRWLGPPDGSGASESEVFAVSAEGGGADGPVLLARGEGDAYLVVWRQPEAGEGLLARSIDGLGRPLSNTQAVASGPVLSAALAARPGGGFVLAWWQGPREDAELRFLGAAGPPLGVTTVTDLPTDAVLPLTQVAAGPDDRFAVSWSWHRRPDSGASTSLVRARTYSIAGEALGPPLDLVPEAEAGWVVEHDLAAVAAGDFLLAWAERPASGSGRLWVRRFGTDGGLGPPHRMDRIQDPETVLSDPALGAAPGGVVIAWSEGRFSSLGIVARLVELDGQPRSAPFEVPEAAKEGHFATGIDVERDAEGRFAVAWGVGIDPGVIPTPGHLAWTSYARRFREPDPACHPILTLDFGTEPSAPEAGDPVRLGFSALTDCAALSLVDWSLDGGAFHVRAEAEQLSCGAFPLFEESLSVEVGALEAGEYPVEIEVDLPAGGTCTRSFGFTVEAADPPPPQPPPPPPDAPPLTSDALAGFRVWVAITATPGDTVLGAKEEPCIPETLCVSGRVPGRGEVFLRMAGPKPNGRLWPTLVKLTTSTVEVWIEQVRTGEVEHYRLEGARPGFDELPGLFDREGFEP